ncbi:anti-sigma factor domain-containing protein [Bacillus salacetis]|uniref:anti-sigma factor domain-containing protein n=1 Tax=Bacillus salacetis TaxID=2315464 RepID=UPI003BA39175
MMKKGIIMEVKPDTIIMMTPEGEFIKTRKQPSVQYNIGEELTFFPQMDEVERKRSILDRLKSQLHIKPVLSGAAALLMLLFILIPSFNEPEVYAYVSVDINPSFEMSINQDQEVINIKPFNKEAEEILKQMHDWEGEPITDVTDEMIDLSAENGYMNAQKKVTVTTVFTEEADTKDKNSLENEIQQLTAEKSEEGTASISVIDSSTEVREEAMASGMTAGQLLLKKEKAKEASPAQGTATPDVSKEEDVEEKPEDMPAAADKRPEHVKEKHADKFTKPNEKADSKSSKNGSDKKLEKENNGNGNGKTNGASQKHSNQEENEKNRGKGNPNGKTTSDERPKNNTGNKADSDKNDKNENRQNHSSEHNNGKGNKN